MSAASAVVLVVKPHFHGLMQCSHRPLCCRQLAQPMRFRSVLWQTCATPQPFSLIDTALRRASIFCAAASRNYGTAWAPSSANSIPRQLQCVTAGTAHDKESLKYIQVTSRYDPVDIGCSRCACYPPPAQPLFLNLLGSCATSEHEHVSQVCAATGARVPVNFHRLCVNFSVRIRLLGE